MSSSSAPATAAPAVGGGGRRGRRRRRSGVRGRRLSTGLVTLLLVLLVGALALPALPRLLGYATLIVRSGSMAETAPVGSLVVARPLAMRDVRVGDVILVRQAGATTPIMHRVVTLSHREGQVVVTTKGDSNATADPTPYELRGATMTPVLAVPHVGRALATARTPLGWTLLIALPGTLLLWFQLRAIWFAPPLQSPEPIATERAPAPA